MKQLTNYLTCKGCGKTILKPINSIFPRCCPDANYIPLPLFLQNAIYSEKLASINNNKKN